MPTKRDNLVLTAAFVGAVALHAALLPWVGSAVGREQARNSPDAVLSFFEIDNHADAGQNLTINCDFHVESDDPMFCSGWLDIYLSNDRSIDERDRHLFRDDFTVMANDRLNNRGRTLADRALPKDADGPHWVIARLSLDAGLTDRDLTNNTRAVPLFIDGPQVPELAVEQFNAPDHATPGGSILIDFTINNIGEGWAANPSAFTADSAPAHWADRVYLSDDATLDETDLPLRSIDRHAPLGPGDTYQHESLEIAIPRGVSGAKHLILVADADQVLDQPSFTAGVAVHPIELIDSAEPDLVVASIEKPRRLVINRPTPVAFSVANLGSGATAGSNWSDGLYLSRDAVLDDQSVPVALSPASQPLQPRSRYESIASVTLPESIEPGQWYLIVKADAQQAVNEGAFEDNNALAVPVMVLTEAQADAEIQLGNPDNPERLVVQWIEHDRLEEHRARLSRTTQPAIQDQADPVPDAPLNFDPQPPAIASRPSDPAGSPANPDRPIDPTNRQDARPDPSATDASESDVVPRPQQPGTRPPERIDGLPGEEGDLNPLRPGIDRPGPNDPRPIDPTPSDDRTPSPEPGDRPVQSPADPTAPDTDRTTDSQTPADRETDTDSKNPEDTDSKLPTEQPDPTESDERTVNPDTNKPSEESGAGDADDKQTDESTTEMPAEDQEPQPDGQESDPAEPSKDQNPTRVARDPSEAPPVSVEKIDVELQEGRVLVGEGIQVTTKLPTPPGTGARRLSVPRNARVRVTFTADGKVYDAEVIKSTTYAEWDAAIEASLYRWTAEGEAVENAEPYIAIEWNYLLNDLFEDE